MKMEIREGHREDKMGTACSWVWSWSDCVFYYSLTWYKMMPEYSKQYNDTNE